MNVTGSRIVVANSPTVAAMKMRSATRIRITAARLVGKCGKRAMNGSSAKRGKSEKSAITTTATAPNHGSGILENSAVNPNVVTEPQPYSTNAAVARDGLRYAIHATIRRAIVAPATITHSICASR
jgi:hypothetical protein